MKKKILLTLLTLSTVASLTACTSNTETTEEISEVVSEETSENITSEDITSEEVVENSTEIIEENTESIENNEEIIENNNPATDMVTKIKENYTQTYRCNMPIETDTMTNVFGITEDMYEYYYGELPMISNHADMILVVKPTEEKYDEVKTKLEEYKNYQINEAFQYPTNAIRVQATEIYEQDGMIYYIAIFGDADETKETEENLLKLSKESVASVIEIIKTN